ncbi:PepSY domain-containing protein [Methylosinus sp. H3A]|uniref:PepSY-associated TM helix domain-containing protein n=1 Tax=Methylosinus sp. H3A TaxID=2785786 RepID=UPI0018C34ECC|nr:PepSY-associated TM helix domain-containing protein [Methylosinus sp. H3A]MBG0812495.1 PepSY domain-containing protein [Methylosinus sp. H3A]
MSRAFWVRVHRWAGLAMAGFLVIVGLTGGVLAFREELDVWLNPELATVAPRDAPMLDPLVLRERAAALYPDARIDAAPLRIEPGRSFEIRVHRRAPEGGALTTFVSLDPYTGEKLGARDWGEVSLARKDIIFFLYRLHYTLALPASTGGLGAYLLGVTALVWTIDCFVSAYLTLPQQRGEKRIASAKSWWSRWRPAWLIKFGAGAYRINFDIHRAFGLWTWAMLLVFAWSSVGFNLDGVYTPTMRALFGLSRPNANPPMRANPLDRPRLDWREARDVGRALLGEQARQNGFAIEREESIALDREHGVYTISAHSSLDIGKRAGASVTFDADTGVLREAAWTGSASEKAGDVIDRWLAALHTAAVFGLPMKIFVCAMGAVIATLSATGVYIWWKKRVARRRHPRASAHVPIAIERRARS